MSSKLNSFGSQTWKVYFYKYLYIYIYKKKIEVLVERLTYLFRLCFSGYFQIFVSPETFWIKLDFFAFHALFMLKKPTHPLLVLLYGVPLDIYFFTLLETCFHIAGHVSHPWKILGSAIVVLFSLLHSLASDLQPGDISIRASDRLATFLRSPCLDHHLSP